MPKSRQLSTSSSGSADATTSGRQRPPMRESDHRSEALPPTSGQRYGRPMIDHVYISVTNIENSLAFYSKALKPLGWREFGSYNSTSGPPSVPDLFGLCDDIYGTGEGVGSSIWLRRRQPGGPASTSASSAGVIRPSPPRTRRRSRQAVSTRANRPTERTSPLGTTPLTSPTSTAIDWSSSIRPGTRSDPLSLADNLDLDPVRIFE